VHVRCNLRSIRERMPRKQNGEPISLRDIEDVAKVSAGVLSQIERGVMIPPDRQISQLEAAYGAPIETWYDPRTLVVLQADGDDA
jgi:transcriptional regulator with XRE-family HTH domain